MPLRPTSKRTATRHTTRRLLAPIAAFGLFVVSAMLAGYGTGRAEVGAAVFGSGVAVLAVWALVDGLRRALGHPTFLGTGQGLDRGLGVLQTLTTIGSMIALLPNAATLLRFVARLVG
ncbi:MAG TPA: hypothetical protein VGW38_10415 [Chloroflexota bacterium]|nr:hypothetical protein [Chloroflexota bacterium]